MAVAEQLAVLGLQGAELRAQSERWDLEWIQRQEGLLQETTREEEELLGWKTGKEPAAAREQFWHW